MFYSDSPLFTPVSPHQKTSIIHILGYLFVGLTSRKNEATKPQSVPAPWRLREIPVDQTGASRPESERLTQGRDREGPELKNRIGLPHEGHCVHEA